MRLLRMLIDPKKHHRTHRTVVFVFFAYFARNFYLLTKLFLMEKRTRRASTVSIPTKFVCVLYRVPSNRCYRIH